MRAWSCVLLKYKGTGAGRMNLIYRLCQNKFRMWRFIIKQITDRNYIFYTIYLIQWNPLLFLIHLWEPFELCVLLKVILLIMAKSWTVWNHGGPSLFNWQYHKTDHDRISRITINGCAHGIKVKGKPSVHNGQTWTSNKVKPSVHDGQTWTSNRGYRGSRGAWFLKLI
jgi:hypothetical protein